MLSIAGILSWSAALGRVAAVRRKEYKDAHHDKLVQVSGGVFFPLVVKSLGLWSTTSCPVLQDIAARTTTKSGIACSLALRHLLEQLYICLLCHNAQNFYICSVCCLAVLCGSWTLPPIHTFCCVLGLRLQILLMPLFGVACMLAIHAVFSRSM